MSTQYHVHSTYLVLVEETRVDAVLAVDNRAERAGAPVLLLARLVRQVDAHVRTVNVHVTDTDGTAVKVVVLE